MFEPALQILVALRAFGFAPAPADRKPLFQEGSAYRNDEVERGDYLFSVNGKEVDGMPYEEAIQVLIDAEGGRWRDGWMDGGREGGRAGGGGRRQKN